MIKQRTKLRNTQYAIRNTNKKGAALLVVLFVVMAITILSLGFLSRSDVELACGQNMILRTKMDYLAESGLQHAKGLILNPQDVGSEYWMGATGQQLVAGSDDYYDVEVVRDDSDPTDRCNYIIDCNAYRRKDSETIGRSSLRAELRLDSCITLWTGADTTLWSGVTIEGDVRCGGTLTNQSTIDGDAFAVGTIYGSNIAGRKSEGVDVNTPLAWPSVTISDFTSRYGTVTIESTLSDTTLGPYNPQRVSWRQGDLILNGNTTVKGMLIVGSTDGSSNNLTVRGTNNVIIAGKNLPALYVTGDLILDKGAILDVNGLAVVDNRVLINGDASLNVLGGFFIGDTLVETAADSSDNGNIGILYNGPTWRPSGGPTSGALEFDGDDDYVQTSDDSTKLQLTGDYTLAVWIKADSTQKDWAGIFSKCDPSGSINHWTLQFDTSNPKKVVIYHPDDKWYTGITLSNIFGGWHHIRVVRRGDIMFSYLDGNPVRSNIEWSFNPGSGDGHLNIGVDRTVFSDFVYKGLIDDICVYNQAPDGDDIYPTGGLIGHWKLDENCCNVTITAAPAKTAILIGPQGAEQLWGQAAGAFFRSVQRR